MISKIAALALIGVCFLGRFAEAQTPNCLAEEDVKRVSSKFRIRVGQELDACDSSNPAHQIARVLLFLEGIKLEGPEPQAPWSQGLIPQNWSSYLEKLSPDINHGKFNSLDPDFCDTTNSVAYVDPMVPKSMFICPSFWTMSGAFQDNMSTYVEMLLHEARHHEGDGYSHEDCNLTGDEGGCDPNAAYKGAYSVSVEALSKLALNATNVHPVTQDYARAFALSRADFNFNEPLYESRTSILLKEKGGGVVRFDGTAIHPALGESSGHEIRPRAKFEFAIFPAEAKGEPSFFQSAAWQKKTQRAADGAYVRTFKAWTPEKREQLVDLIYTTSLNRSVSAIMTGSSLSVTRYQDEASTEYEIVFDKGRALRLFTADDLNASADNRLYVLNDKEELYRIELLEEGKSSVASIPNPIKGFVALSKIGEKQFLLDREGRVFVREKGKLNSVKALEHARFEWMSRAFLVTSGTPWN